MSAGCPHEVDLLDWLEDPATGSDHLTRCAGCADALEDMRQLRALARSLGAHGAPRRRWCAGASASGPRGRDAEWLRGRQSVPRGRRARAEDAPHRRSRALGVAQRVASTVAALALFAAMGAEPLLRRRIDDGGGRPAAMGEVAAGGAGTVFWTSIGGGALAVRVGR